MKLLIMQFSPTSCHFILCSNTIFKLDQLRNWWLLMYRSLKASVNIWSFGYRLTHPRTHSHIRNELTCNKRYVSYYSLYHTWFDMNKSVKAYSKLHATVCSLSNSMFLCRSNNSQLCGTRVFIAVSTNFNRLFDLVVRVPGYRSRGLGFDSRCYQIFWEVVGLERSSLSLVRITEELLERKVAAPV
jgi:hypothetical protein